MTREGPRGNYSGLGAIQNILVRNLSQLEKASPEAHAAAVRAASSSGQVEVLLRAAVPKIQQALGPKGPTWDEFRLALIESRQRGIRRRWETLARWEVTARSSTGSPAAPAKIMRSGLWKSNRGMLPHCWNE